MVGSKRDLRQARHVCRMPKYIDSHSMGPVKAQQLHALQTAPADEFGVAHHDILYNEGENRIWCVLDAPDEEAVRRHHAKVGIDCEFVTEVHSTRT